MPTPRLAVPDFLPIFFQLCATLSSGDVGAESSNMLAKDLPFDVLADIFIQCLTESPRKERQPDTRIAPMLLCQICSAWRTAALRIPQLWTHLCLKFTFRVDRVIYHRRGRTKTTQSDEQYVASRTLEFFDWWAANANPLPMSIYLDNFRESRVSCFLDDEGAYTAGFRPGEDTKTVTQFFTHAFRSAAHLELALGRNGIHKLSVLINVGPTTFDSLKSLTLHGYSDLGHEPNVASAYAFPPAPHLRRLHLPSYRDMPAFFWIELTHLCISSAIRKEDWLELLTNCRNLTSAAFQLDNLTIEDDLHGSRDDLSRIHHRNLQQLVIGLTTFDSVYFPALKALRIVPSYWKSPVKSFTALAALLKATPQLTELHFDANLFESLKWSPHAFRYEISPQSACQLSILLPSLERLTFDEIGYDGNENARDILNLLKSGWMEVCPRGGLKGQVELIFDLPNSSISTDAQPEQMNDIAREIKEYLDAHKDSLGYNVQLRHQSAKGSRYRYAPYALSKDLSRWEEAMGFYHRCPE